MKIIVPLSGGKDSQASLLWAIEKYGLKNITAVFCDTKWESDITYNHIKYLVEKTGVHFVDLVSKKYNGMVDLAKKKSRFPSTKRRICTVELKIIPMIDYILSLQDHILIIQGIRADESEARRLMKEQCRYFKYYFEPYQTNSMIVDNLSAKENLSLIQRKTLLKALERLKLGKEDKKFHTYRKKEVFEFCKAFVDDIHRPFFYATGNEVIYYSLNRGYEINPLYFKGFSRVGCFPCVQCNQKEIDIIISDFPERIKEIDEAEKYTGSTFFKPDSVPERYRSGFDEKSGKKITPIEDVVRYSSDRNATFDLFADTDEFTCKSVYAICE